MERDKLRELELSPLGHDLRDPKQTVFTQSVDATDGVTTGISASDRTITVRTLIDPSTTVSDLSRPGHVFPLRSRPGGVLTRARHTEASVDLTRLGGLYPAGVLATVVAEDGSVATGSSLTHFAEKHGLLLGTIDDLIEYRRSREGSVVERGADTLIPTPHGGFTAIGYRSLDGVEDMAMVKGDISGEEPVLCHIHSECLVGDAFGSLSCGCRTRLDSAMSSIASAGRGVVVYLRDRSEGAVEFVRSDTGDGKVPRLGGMDRSSILTSDLQQVASDILSDLGVGSLTLVEHEASHAEEMRRHGFTVTPSPPTGFSAGVGSQA